MTEFLRASVRVVNDYTLLPLILLGGKLFRLAGLKTSPLSERHTEDCLPPFPVHAVYTWVDDTDPVWTADKERWLAESDNVRGESYHASRFRNRDELKFSLRSIEKHAQFISKIYIVTNGQVPDWLRLNDEKLEIVSHKTIFEDHSGLPTFNCFAIESCLHRIPGLSEHFIYLNDDFFFGRPVQYGDFFTREGKPVSHLSGKKLLNEEPTESDTTYERSIKNSRRLLEVPAGSYMEKFAHVPYSLKRSTLSKLAEKFGSEFDRTRMNRFRSDTDVGVTNSLAQIYADQTQSGIIVSHNTAGFTDKYVNIGSPFLRSILAYILYFKTYSAFCLNETIKLDTSMDSNSDHVEKFLSCYFPEPSRFEADQNRNCQEPFRTTSVD